MQAATRLKGIDVSHLQGAINWSAVKADQIDFAYIKASEGETFVDQRYRSNQSSANQQNINTGSYHFFRPQGDPIAQAKLFLLSADFSEGDLTPVLDAEVFEGVTVEEYQKKIKTWLDIVTAALGNLPMIYSNPNFINQYISSEFSDYPLWLARWSMDPTPLPDGWLQWACWQYSSTGRIRGIETAVDLDYLNKRLRQQLILKNNNTISNSLKDITKTAYDIFQQKESTKKLSDFEQQRMKILSRKAKVA